MKQNRRNVLKFGLSGAVAGIGGVGTLTLDAGLTVRGYGTLGQWSSPSNIINNGAIEANTAAQTLTINPNAFTNNGSATVTFTPTYSVNGTVVTATSSITWCRLCTVSSRRPVISSCVIRWRM